MQRAAPRRRPARPVPEAPVEALAADADRLAKGWLLAAIEEQPLSEASAVAAGPWTEDAPRLCAAVLRGLVSDDELRRIGPAPAGFADRLDPLRAVLWSALRGAWPDAEPDQVWDLGERLALVLGALSAAGPAWPGTLEQALARVQATGEGLALLLAEPVDAERLLALETGERSVAIMSRFREAVRGACSAGAQVVEDGRTRVWVIAPGAGREHAAGLGEEIGAAVRAAPPWRGAPLEASVGAAVLGEDGEDAAGLIEAAEEAMFAAAASGIEIERRPR